MKRLMLVLGVMFLLMGVVSADRSLYNVVNISIPSDIIAGDLFEANFSFDYYYGGDNVEDSPLIIKLDIVSQDDAEYPVWKGDFEISGRVEKSWFFNILTETVDFNCSEEYNQTIEHPLDAQNVTAEDGVFYCYNEEGDLNLNEHDEVFLDITSNQALYPGEYDFSATMFYLEDERAPFVNITNKGLFNKYYRENDNVLVRANISDASGISQQWSNVMINGVEIFPVIYDHFDNEEYYFTRNTPVDIVEDDYDLFVFAEDMYGNEGNDSVILKIDRSAPSIGLVNWTGDVVSGILPIEVSVDDEKSGTDNDSVEYRLREMNGTSICPEGGIGTWDCYNSGWLILPFVSGDLFAVDFNTTEVGLNGEYWLEVRAMDVLGNMGVLE
jgi:hypothetical protein